MSKVSVIIPCYNRASLVAETIRNVLNQSLPPHEIIAVDDGSTDNTLAVLESFGPRLTILRQANAGPGAARNAGLAIATGEFVWFMDSDDLAALNKLEVQVRALEKSNAAIAFGPWIKCRLDPARAIPETHVLQQRGLPVDPARALVTNWSALLQTALFRRSLLQQVGGFHPDPGFIVVEDQLLFLKCFLAGAKLVHTPESLVVYRSDNASKLTAGGFASERRHINLANWLLEARRLFLETSVDPCRWFSFRLRLWCARRDLSAARSQNARAVIARIDAALGDSANLPIYFAVQKFTQWLGGLRQRIFGDRSPLALQAAPANPRQVELLSDLGYCLSPR